MPIRYEDTEACADELLERVDGELRLAAPLGLGKPHALLNALYRRVRERPERSLAIYTALSLTRPQPAPGLESRFLEPFLRRYFGEDAVDPEYARDQARDALPPNVRVHEFYMQSGALLRSAGAQRDYISLNYTHAARDLAQQGINLAVQLVALSADGRRASLSCNPDMSLDLLDQLRAQGKPRPLYVGVVHPELPYMPGSAEVAVDEFDVLLAPPRSPPLFAVPRQPVRPAEYALGLHASALMGDGGCLQIGIGALSDALVKGLLLRQQENAAWREALAALDGEGRSRELAGRIGGLAPFATGLYGASEMVMDGFMHLARAGVLRRRAWDELALEREAAAGRPPGTGGHYLRGAFFLGSRELYAWLHDTVRADPAAIDMCRVSNVNHLYGDHQALAALQRRGARFYNTCMIATLLGEAASDGLEDGRVVSGVGGQYNFVAMAHELADGRSVLMLRATRQERGRLVSNIRWNYGYCTVPRHLRDVYVTEYGVADLRGKSDRACVEAMLAISDARFLDELAGQAKAQGKLPADFRIPEAWRRNTPEHLDRALAPLQDRGLLPDFPFGSDFTETERRLLPALAWLKAHSASRAGKLALLRAALAPGRAGTDEGEALARMGLASPRGLPARFERRLLQAALRRTQAWR